MKRRDFLSGLGTSAYLFAELFETVSAGIVDEAFSSSSSDNLKNYVCFHVPGGAEKVWFDSILTPNTGDSLGQGAGIFNYLTVNGQDDFSWSYRATNSPVNGKFHLPYLWESKLPDKDGGTVNMTSLADNLIILRGLKTGLSFDAHSHNTTRVLQPMAHNSIAGAVADKTYDRGIDAIGSISHFLSSSNRTMANIGPNENAYSVFSRINQVDGGGTAYPSSPTSMLGHSGMNNIVTDFINTLSSRQPSRKNDVKEVLMDNRSKAIALLERGFDSIESDYSSTYAVYQSIIAAVCDPTGERLLEGFDKEPVSGRGVQFRVWTDENPNYNDDDIKNGFRTAEMNSLAHMMAKTEIFLKHKISRSLLFASSEITNVRDVHSYNHGVGRTVGFDMHFTGAVMRAFAMSRYYQAMSACIIHLRSQLSGLQNDDGTGSIWDETMIHINTEFTRGAWEEGGSHHNIWGCSDTIITGKMKDGPLVVGDIVTSASSTCTGNGAPVEALGNAVAESKHVYSTIGELMGYEKSRNHPSLLTNSDGTITSAIGLPKNVEQG